MVQHEGCDVFEYASFGYNYLYTDNAGIRAAAETLAIHLGATNPIEHRTRNLEFELQTAEVLRDQIAELTNELAELENKTPNA